ncbi:hypothetical protein [Geminocystis sp. NIES-3709]|uniref:hypothetical protein n=1 Tax=Geminocystis sp. NIES-3709 TaxID=1617448 RepID=UPI0005FCCC72|nr:hypothetical protein [Geminocystis sp. NIES-3709]BAQ64520.1 hypothetical protein GM3709_1285 [Geminocystis sp. NIES-3709]
MFVPLISALIAIIIIFFTVLTYKGKIDFLSPKLSEVGKDNKLVCIGLILISFGFLLGLVGYGFKFGGNFRYCRFLLMIIGFISIKISLANNLAKLPQLPNFIQFFINLNAIQSLKIFAGIIISFLFLKSLVAVDWINGDTWMYQLPFAARFWGLVSPEHYIFEAEREPLYNTSTMLPNILQGFFWYLFGIKRPQGANLVSFLSLIGYFIFLKNYLKIPYYLSIITILAVPLIHIASTSCYVDLITNVGFSITIILSYLLFLKEDFINYKNIFIFILGGFITANSKYLLVPPLALLIFIIFLRILWLIYFRFNAVNKIKNIVTLIFATIGTNIIIFLTSFKNLLLYQNPFYPLKITIFGHELNHTVVPSDDYMSAKIQAMSSIQRWVFSLLEIGAFDDRRPWKWTIAMDYVPLDADTFGLGGYFAIYVVFNVVLFGFLCRKNTPETKIALGFVIVMSILTPFLPFSYQLRYYMYWIIVLITLNLYLLLQQYEITKNSWIKPQYYGYVGTIIMMIFMVSTRWDYTYPNAMSLDKFMNNDNRVNPNVIAILEEKKEACLVGFTPLTFLYNSQFHDGKNYSVKAEFNLSKEEVEKKCGDRTIIYKEN